MINYFVRKNGNILSLEYDGLKIHTDRYYKHFSINELELNIYKNIGINIKLAFNTSAPIMMTKVPSHQKIMILIGLE